MEPPEYVTLLPDEEDIEEDNRDRRSRIAKRLVVNVATVMLLKIATGIAIKNLSRTIKEFDILYPEHLDRIKWKDPAP